MLQKFREHLTIVIPETLEESALKIRQLVLFVGLGVLTVATGFAQSSAKHHARKSASEQPSITVNASDQPSAYAETPTGEPEMGLSVTQHNDYQPSLLGVFFAVLVGIPLYFAPAFVAHKKDKKSASAITVLNVLLGWTFIGWVVALVWALAYEEGAREFSLIDTDSEPTSVELTTLGLN